MSEILIEVGDPAAIFSEWEGEARISYADLEAQGDDGRAVLTAIRDYVTAHPKLEARFWRHENALVGVELVIAWRWRR